MLNMIIASWGKDCSIAMLDLGFSLICESLQYWTFKKSLRIYIVDLKKCLMLLQMAEQ